jgi:hypothetical protein
MTYFVIGACLFASPQDTFLSISSGMTPGREGSSRRRQTRNHRAPGFRIAFIGVKSHGHHHARDDVAAPHTQDAADGTQDMNEIGVQGTGYWLLVTGHC